MTDKQAIWKIYYEINHCLCKRNYSVNNKQTYKLEKAIQNIEDILRLQNETNPRIMVVWLSVAGDYCNEVAEEIKEVIL